MSIETILAEEAAYIARNMYGAASTLEAELREIERRKAEIDATLNAAKLAQKRLLNFHPRIGAGFQCPRCWVQNEKRSALTATPSSTGDDILRCHMCMADYLIPFR
jgi:hypothetical protein